MMTNAEQAGPHDPASRDRLRDVVVDVAQFRPTRIAEDVIGRPSAVHAGVRW